MALFCSFAQLSFFFTLLACLSLRAVGEEYASGENGCNVFQGSWVFDDSYQPSYDSGCPFISGGLNCLKNGRPDDKYLKYRWKPDSCDLERFDGQDFLQKMGGKKIMFVGDSLSSNQWQSLACMLHSSVPNSNYTIVQDHQLVNLSFPDYRISIMFLKNGFLVDLEVKNIGRILKLDSISRADLWKEADILIFNSYHWWIHTGRLQTWDYFQVGSNISKDMDHMEAYKIALSTWATWVDSNIDPSNTRVFFQGISAIHNHGEDWNEPAIRSCDGQIQPVQGSNYPGNRYPGEAVVKNVLGSMSKPVYLLDITLLTQLRKDGHPSRYTNGFTDCSHWCLAGVPDTWNQLLYTILIEK